jgi:hypothetical protein
MFLADCESGVIQSRQRLHITAKFDNTHWRAQAVRLSKARVCRWRVETPAFDDKSLPNQCEPGKVQSQYVFLRTAR